MKLKIDRVVKYDNGEKYVFINGIAYVPGTTFQRKPMPISIKEFKELQQQVSQGEAEEES